MYRIVLLLTVLNALPAICSAGNRYDIHVLTMGPGKHLFTRFGHIALMLQDNKTRTKKVYNFGEFDFKRPDLRTRYALGDLQYWVAISSYDTTIKHYQTNNRKMTIRTLDLTEEQTLEMVKQLKESTLPKNRKYEYNHYTNNCCTRIRDLINQITNGAISKANRHIGRTYRYWTSRALDGMPFIRTMILFSLGPSTDRPVTRWNEQFLPEILANDIDGIFIDPDRRPLVKEKRVIYNGGETNFSNARPTTDYVFITVFLGMLFICFGFPMVVPRRRISMRLYGVGLVIWGVASGAGGLLLTLAWAITRHSDTYFNENLIIFPFVHLWLIGPGLMLVFRTRLSARTTRLLRAYLIISLALIAFDLVMKLGPFIQDNAVFVAFASICNIAALFLVGKRSPLSL
ncbi:MAG: DUF4105 domain-containing protein [Proteobacteria bacterium]|nr:DUF4105 domain-containing protein [Pseudomonadota bacterium]